MFQVNDLVQVVMQPSNHFAKIVGQAAFIEEIEDDYCHIVTLHPDGRVGGVGTVPSMCLEPYDAPGLKKAKEAYDSLKAEQIKVIKLRQENFKKAMEPIAEKWGMSYEKLMELRSDLLNADEY